MRYAGAIIFTLLFATLAAALLAGATLPFDMAVRAGVHRLASNELTVLARLFTFIGENFVWLPATLVAAALLWLRGRRKQAMALALAMLGATILENGLKLAFHRLRPEPFYGSEPATFSFPSGHALFAVCFYGALGAIVAAEVRSAVLRTVLWIVALMLMLCIGLSRIYLGVHYPTDVLAGYVVAAAWLTALQGAGKFRFPRNLSSATQPSQDML